MYAFGFVFLPVMTTSRPQLLHLCISTLVSETNHSVSASQKLLFQFLMLSNFCSIAWHSLWHFPLGPTASSGRMWGDELLESWTREPSSVTLLSRTQLLHFCIFSLQWPLPWSVGFTVVYADYSGRNAQGYREVIQQHDSSSLPEYCWELQASSVAASFSFSLFPPLLLT